MLSTSGEFVEVLNFREDNEESSEETTGCKASVYAKFDECTQSENFIEILRFRHFARYMSFKPTGKQSKKKQIMNGIEVSVVLHPRYGENSKCSESQFDVGRYPVTSALKRFQTSAHLYTILISKQTYLRPFNTNKDRIKKI